MGFAGDLKDMSLADLLQSIQQNKRTGTLLLLGVGAEKDAVYVEEGAIAGVAPAEGAPPGGFAEVLRRTRAVPAKELDKAQKKRGRKLLRTTLAELGLLEESAYKGAAEGHIRDVVADIFLKPRGRFEFKEGEPDRAVFDPDLISSRAAVEAQGVIMEGSRRIDEWGRLGRRIGGTDEIFVPAVTADGEEPASARISSEAGELLELLDGRRDVASCVAELPFGRFRTLELLGELLEARRARMASPEELSETAERLAKDGDVTGAVALVRRALEHARNAVAMRERLADLLERAGRREEAAQERKLLAATRAGSGDLPAAIAEYERAAQLVPSDPTPLERALDLARQRRDAPATVTLAKRLAERLTSLGLPERARSIYVELLGDNPVDGEIAERLGEVLERMGDRREAAAVFRRLGRERERRRDPQGALMAYRRAVGVDPGDGEAKRLIEDLETGRAIARALAVRRGITVAVVTVAVVVGGLSLARELFARRALKDAHQATLFHPGPDEDRAGWIDEYRKVARAWPWTFAGHEAGELADGLRERELERAAGLEREGRRTEAEALRRRVGGGG